MSIMSRSDPLSSPPAAADHSGAARRRDAGVLAHSPRARAIRCRRCSARARRRRTSPSCAAGWGSIGRCYVQYAAFLKGAAPAISGTSLRTNQPVTAAIAERMPATFELAHRGDGRRDAHRDPARHRRRRSGGHRASTHAATTLALRRHLDAELLARAAAGDRVFDHARLAAGVGPRHAGAPRAAGDHARRAAGGRAGADDAGERHRGTARAVRAGGARARRVARAGRAPSRLPQQPDPDRHGARACSSAPC